MTEDEMVGWHHRLDGHEFEETPGVGDGQDGLACCSPWGRKESDMTERLNNEYESEVNMLLTQSCQTLQPNELQCTRLLCPSLSP